jgi:hypothetical protein
MSAFRNAKRLSMNDPLQELADKMRSVLLTKEESERSWAEIQRRVAALKRKIHSTPLKFGPSMINVPRSDVAMLHLMRVNGADTDCKTRGKDLLVSDRPDEATCKRCIKL